MGSYREDDNGDNAVAPDWNLKAVRATGARRERKNAVAPDWNLKVGSTLLLTVSPKEMQSHQIGI